MTITKCDVCGADIFNKKEMKKGKVIFTNRKKLIFIDLCPNCYKYGNTFYVKRKGEVAKMDKQEAIYILKNTGYIGNDVGLAFQEDIRSMEKLEKIEQIIKAWNNDASHSFSDMCKINEVMKR